MTMREPIKKYSNWVYSAPGAHAVIKQAQEMSDFFRTQRGQELYMKYLAENPAQRIGIAKSQPTPSDVHVNVPLTNIAIAYLQDQAEFIADRVFANIPVPKQSDRYIKYDKGNWFRSQAQPRAPGSESAGTGYTIDNTPTYSCVPIAVHHNIDDQTRANADSMIDLDRNATELVMRQLALRREKDWAAKFFTTGVWTGSTGGGDIVPGTLWSASGSTPIEDMRKEISSVKSKTGYKPNTLVLGHSVWNVLQDHPSLLSRIQYTQRGIVGLDLLAAVLEIDQVYVASGVENTAAEGATDTMAFVMDSKDALLCYSNPRPGLMVPSAGYIFSWTGYTGAGPAGQRIKRFRVEEKESDCLEGQMAYDQKVIAPDLGVFFNGAVA